ncbi:MAG: hypothetical protein WCV50_01770 [Patescibacteria group bacterium]
MEMFLEVVAGGGLSLAVFSGAFARNPWKSFSAVAGLIACYGGLIWLSIIR